MSNKASRDYEYLNSLIAEANNDTEENSTSNLHSTQFKESIPSEMITPCKDNGDNCTDTN